MSKLIELKDNNSRFFINRNKVTFLREDNNYTYVHFSGGDPIRISLPISKVKEIIDMD